MVDFDETLYDEEQEEVVASPSNPEEDAGRESVVDSQDVEDADGDEKSEPQDAAETGDANRRTVKQTRRVNHEAKLARQAAQRETEERMRADLDRQIAQAGLDNPYTGKRMESLKDFQEYTAKIRDERLEAEAKRTGKSVAVLREEEENREFISKLRMQAQSSAQRGTEAPTLDLQQDAMEFAEAHPDVDIVKLEQDQSFRRFAGTRLYRESLTQLYDDYLEITGAAGKSAVAKAESKAKRSTGGGSTGGDIKLTNAQQKELEEWNRRYPGMKMTAKEFVGK